MPPDPHQEYLKRKAQRSKEIAESNANARGVLKKSWDVANEPLWHGPQRWGREASDWLTTPVSGESPTWAMTKGAAGGMLEGVGNVASGITSPIGIATTAMGLGSTKYAASAVPALAELAASRPVIMGAKTLSGLGAGRGALRIGEAALNEDDKSWMERMGDVGTGSLELVGGLAGTQIPLPPKGAPPRPIGTPGTGTMPTGTPMTKGPVIPSMLGDVEGIRTSTSPKLPASPVIGTRMSTVEPTKMSAGAPNLPARDISPERSAFEALVPNRYKTQMTAEGLTLNLPERFTATESTPSTTSVKSPPTTTPKAETAATSTPTPTTAAKFDISKYTDENLAAMAKRGNAEAVAEVSRRRALAENKAAGKKKAEAAPPKSPTAPAAPPKKPAKPAAPPPVVQEPPAAPTPVRMDLLKAAVEKAKAERAAAVAAPVPGQAGVTPVPEGVTVTKVPPGKSGVVEKPVVAKVPKVAKAKTEMPLPGKSPLAPKPVDKWALIEKDLLDQGIPKAQVDELITRGKSGEIESAPVEEILAAHKAKGEAPAKPAKVKVDPKRAATLRAEANAAAEIPRPEALAGIPEKIPSNERPLAYAKDETIDARAKGGDALAAQELKWRQAEAGSSFMDAMSATVAGAKKAVKKVVGEETGAVGPGTGKLIREQEAAKARKAAMEESHPFNYDLEGWKKEQLEMGHTQSEIDEAVRRSTRHGIDPTKSDDLGDLEHFMMAQGELDWRQESRQLGHLGNKDLMDWEKNQRLGPVEEPPTPKVLSSNTDWAADRESLARAHVADEIANPRPLSPEDYPGQKQFVSEIQDARNRQNFELRKRMAPDKYAQDIGYVKRDYPEFTDAQVEQHVYNKFAESQDEIARSISEESQGRHFEKGKETDDWGKYRPQWEDTPFRSQDSKPEITGEYYDSLKAAGRLRETQGRERLVPNERWYAGQTGIDRQQVERVKRYGPNDPGEAADWGPSLEIDENGNYQITDGHHRSTAALETGKAVDYDVTDRSPEGWFRKMRDRQGKNDPFHFANEAEANRGIASFDRQGASSGTPELDRPSAWERLLGEETGAAGPGTGAIAREQRRNRGPELTGGKKLAQDAFDAVNQARMTSMLSGLALPKSLLGNIGSHFTAAAENRSLAPLKALGDYKAIGSDLATGWKAAENPTLAGGVARWNLPGRAMGAADHAATQSLMRSGLSEAAAKEILLTSPNPVSGWGPLNTNLGKMAVPFKTTPFNQFGQGLSRYAKHPGIYAGSAALGAGAGLLTDDPEKLALGAGFVGPYALPFTMGAMATAGARAGQGLSPIPEWSLQKSFSEPQAPFTESPGFRWFEPGFGFGSKAKDKTGSRPTSSSRPTGRPTGRK